MTLFQMRTRACLPAQARFVRDAEKERLLLLRKVPCTLRNKSIAVKPLAPFAAIFVHKSFFEDL